MAHSVLHYRWVYLYVLLIPLVNWSFAHGGVHRAYPRVP